MRFCLSLMVVISLCYSPLLFAAPENNTTSASLESYKNYGDMSTEQQTEFKKCVTTECDPFTRPKEVGITRINWDKMSFDKFLEKAGPDDEDYDDTDFILDSAMLLTFYGIEACKGNGIGLERFCGGPKRSDLVRHFVMGGALNYGSMIFFRTVDYDYDTHGSLKKYMFKTRVFSFLLTAFYAAAKELVIDKHKILSDSSTVAMDDFLYTVFGGGLISVRYKF